MKWVLLVVAILIVGCTSSDPQVEDTTSEVPTTVSVPTSRSTTTTAPIELSEDERAIAAARQAVLDANVMGPDFAQNSTATLARQGDTIAVTIVPADPDVIGATAVIILQAADLSVVEVEHYR